MDDAGEKSGEEVLLVKHLGLMDVGRNNDGDEVVMDDLSATKFRQDRHRQCFPSMGETLRRSCWALCWKTTIVVAE